MRFARSKSGTMWASRPTRCDRIRRKQARIRDGSARDVEDAVPYDKKGNATISADPVGRDAHIAPRSTGRNMLQSPANPRRISPLFCRGRRPRLPVQFALISMPIPGEFALPPLLWKPLVETTQGAPAPLDSRQGWLLARSASANQF